MNHLLKQEQKYLFVKPHNQDMFLDYTFNIYRAHAICVGNSRYGFSPIPSVIDLANEKHGSFADYVKESVSEQLYGDPWRYMSVEVDDNVAYFNSTVEECFPLFMHDVTETYKRNNICFRFTEYSNDIMNIPVCSVW
ncbi:hypothetical protein ACQKJG_18790 [Priestia megaterium]|uniref:hypothetical protein n=1 Tax=Priestia megaterium TaxID=1404 RepID=UPI003CFDA621